LDRLRNDPDFKQLEDGGPGYDPYFECVGSHNPDVLIFHLHEAFWQLLVEGIVAPGKNSSNLKLPWFHVTEYGHKVLAADPPHPHDPERYLGRIAARVPDFDPTVRSYLAESLATFGRGNLVSATVMLGIAAERAFLLLCESAADALANAAEEDQFRGLLARFPMKPKLDWITVKFQEQSVRALAGFPDNAQIAILAVYDLLRVQRNELGHPKEAPPAVEREDVFSGLQVFARYYEIVEKIRVLLSANQI
jgi:hypothetical protein